MRVTRPTTPTTPRTPAHAPAAKTPTKTTAAKTVKNTPPATARDARDFGRYLQDQGNTNSCGTTSLAMLMSFWKGTPGAYTHQQIDKSIRVFDGPTAPSNIVSYLRGQGFRAEAVNNASVNDIRKYLDQGVPVQVLYDPSANPSDLYLHYVDIVDYKADAAGNIVSLKIADPAGGKLKDVPVAEFQKRWQNLHLKNVDLGVNNLMIVALPKQNVPVKGRDGTVRNSNDIALPKNGGNLGWQMKVADVIADVTNWAGKAGKAIGGFFKGLFG